jgi:hypothetical protein
MPLRGNEQAFMAFAVIVRATLDRLAQLSPYPILL